MHFTMHEISHPFSSPLKLKIIELLTTINNPIKLKMTYIYKTISIESPKRIEHNKKKQKHRKPSLNNNNLKSTIPNKG